LLIAYDWPEQATDGLAPIQGLRFQNIFPPRPGRSGALFGIPHVLSLRQNERSPSKATVRQSSTAFSPSSKYAPSDRPINRELSGHNQPGWQFRQCGIPSETSISTTPTTLPRKSASPTSGRNQRRHQRRGDFGNNALRQCVIAERFDGGGFAYNGKVGLRVNW
jgi:hypothetical protein